VDELTGSTANPIESYFETSDISLAAAEQSQNKSLRVTLIEPDFVQSGPNDGYGKWQSQCAVKRNY
jgi:hypothetical protein